MERMAYQNPTVERFNQARPEGEHGLLKKWFPEKGFGFVQVNGVDIYFKASAACKDLIANGFKGSIYALGIHTEDRGYSVDRVCCEMCATPGHVEALKEVEELKLGIEIADANEPDRTDRFADEVIDLVGIDFGRIVLGKALDADRDPSSRKRYVFEEINGLDKTEAGRRFKGIGRAKDVDLWLSETLTLLNKKKTELAAKNKPAVVSGATFADLMKKFGK